MVYTSATFVPGGYDDEYYMPPPPPELISPEPQRINPEMSNQIADGLHHMNLHNPNRYSEIPLDNDIPHLSPFPKLNNPPPNVPPSDEEVEATLENARLAVLNSNDPEMQLAWAQDTLMYVGVCADHEERLAAAKPMTARAGTPRIEHQLKTDAMNVVTFLADQHHPKAEFLRGMWLEWGRFGHREDKKEAFRCYSRAADRDYVRAQYRIGMLYESYNDPIKALRHYHRGVDAGDAASCYRLGMMTLRGQHGQQQDFARGLDLIRKSAQAADENAAQGAYVYGMLLARQLPQIEIPEGYLQSDERAARINVEKAAYLKFAKAQLKMGSAYELGALGCQFDPALSMHYYALASKQGEAEADMGLSKWFLVGSEGLFPKNESLAYTYAEQAAQSGLVTAEFALGYFNEIGMHVPVNLDKALEWYQKAAKHGNEDARGRIDGLSRKQYLSRKDHEKVAITRIKSTYGSVKGYKPERFRLQEERRPKGIAEESAVAAKGYAGYGYGNGNGNGGGATATRPPASGMRLSSSSIQPPPRGDSITPYPLDNRPPALQPLDQRPASVAPYPLEDGPPKATPRLGPTGGFFNANPPPRPATTVGPADMRPSSAFQFNADARSHSASTVPQLPSQSQQGGRASYNGPQTQPYAHSYGPAPNSRPATIGAGPSPQNMPPYQPGSGPGPGIRPPNQRIASGPPAPAGYGPRPMGISPAAPPQPGILPHHPTAPPGQLPQAMESASRLDIGFSAPPESRSNSYGPRPPPPNASGARAPLPRNPSMPNFDQQQGQGQGGPPHQPNQQQQPAASSQQAASGGGGVGGGGGGGRASLPSSRPLEARQRKPSGPAFDAGGGGVGVTAAAHSRPTPVSTPKPNTGTSSAPGSAATGSQKPAKGPKTFDEMGVPAQKSDGTCAVM
ncbi:hypothetical protein LTR78_003001 [Recurvomyces mirabilis]|uniref:Uncharacterized protein n=1 Tax=Recurvomyces mirabilis TaxID=574656 RepID=A0AAE0WTB4_9PEZI|nr:hypothetical protein LTR78_003001 [Recurvomyces mirabilis]KAK5159268.1 hypothetical protein LTS14_002410 [Recurvomyces mirabilis]